MGMPPKKELERVRKKLEKVEPTHGLPPNASKSDKLKYELCKMFVIHLNREKISQKDLAEKLGMEPARLNEIVKYLTTICLAERKM